VCHQTVRLFKDPKMLDFNSNYCPGQRDFKFIVLLNAFIIVRACRLAL
jgi:hypothetical protein